MGAKQSKRSVDISGKEAEGGGEVAAAGAGGEGRVEPLADADALKPQLNGDAHIQTEQTDKEKELDSGTPENEKDATTEKEGKEENEKENETAPVTNCEAEEKIENGESTPAPDDGKKPKKEKVKKKWSLRSISFSRKDKPKQEKKQKDDELKTNGEPEKVPEETAEAAAAGEPAAEVATEAAAAEPAAAETAATPQEPPAAAAAEPLTNGTAASTPSPMEEAPAPAPAPAEPEPTPAPAPEPEPDQLPVNGLSLEEPKPELPVDKADESKPEPPAAETVEIAPAPEIPAKEVCVQQMPLLESTPPPLPANPPPSSVASFAATTMAPELTDASIPNTTDTAADPLSALPNAQPAIDEVPSPPPTPVSDAIELPSPLKETSEDMPPVLDVIEPEVQIETTVPLPESNESEVPNEVEVVSNVEDVVLQDIPVLTNDQNEPSQGEEIKEQREQEAEVVSERIPEDTILVKSSPEPKIEQIPKPEIEQIPAPEIEQIPESEITTSEIDDTPLPPPPAQDDIEVETNLDLVEQNGEDDIKVIPEPIIEPEAVIEANHVSIQELSNGVDACSLEEDSVTAENAKNKAKAAAPRVAENGVGKVECNGNATDDGSHAEILTELAESEAAATEPAPPAASHTPQEPVSVSDKLSDLIPEVPDVPEINTETLQATATDVAVAN